MSGSLCTGAFSEAAGSLIRKPREKLPPPFSIRFTREERARLNRDAGSMAMSAYIRRMLFGNCAVLRQARYLHKQRRPAIDDKTVAAWLGSLGRSELATSMMAIALAAQSGALPVTPELSGKLDTACDDIGTMRDALFVALRIKPERGR